MITMAETNNLEKGLIDMIDMILECNFDNYETGLDLTDNEKIEIAQDIIDGEDGIWDELHSITMEYMVDKFKEKRDYLLNKEKVAPLDKEEKFELENLIEYID